MPFVIDKFKSKNGASVSEEFFKPSKYSVFRDIQRFNLLVQSLKAFS